MKKIILGIGFVFMTALAGSVFSEEMSRDMGHRAAMGNDLGEMDSGDLIREGGVEGYHFTYHLLDIREKMAAMKAAGHAHEGVDATHHLMVFIRDPNGATVGGATVGYFVEGPDGTTQKLMCMGMSGGYGSDINFSGTGTYVIKTRVVAGDVKLVDEFTYTTE
jgi:hypothetical protein